MVVRDRRLRWPIAAKFEAAVRNQIIRSVDRRAKYLLIRLETGTVILQQAGFKVIIWEYRPSST